MKSTEYIYGVTIESLPKMDEALRARITASQQLLDKLLEVPLKDRDFHRIAAVCDAINFNNKLLHGAV